MKSVAQTPPMGWNSWDCYGASVTEAEVRGNAEYMAEHLLASGWEYVVVDIQWYEPGAFSSQYRPFVPLEMDDHSRLMPAPNRFPSAQGGQGFKPLADFVHGLGLKFGIHIMRGIPRQAVHQNAAILGTTQRARDIAHPHSICPWNTDMYGVDPAKEGAQEYYQSLFDLYASWGVDFVKVDDIAASRLYGYHKGEVELIQHALKQCGREMVLSLSPGPADVQQAEHLKTHANMWRMTDDLWDLWEHIEVMFERCHVWTSHRAAGHWPDADMLPLGHIGIRSVDGGGSDRFCRLTHEEQRTLMTLWCIARSPLMFGGELRDLDPWTQSLITNPEVLEMHRTSEGNRQLFRKDHQVVWTARGPRNQLYLALFNLAEASGQICVNLADLGLASGTPFLDLWTAETANAHSDLAVRVPPHGAKLYRFAVQL